MKATFSFNLPEETEEYETYRKAPQIESFLSGFEEYLRRNRKYGITDDLRDKFGDNPLVLQVVDAIEEIYYQMKNDTD